MTTLYVNDNFGLEFAASLGESYEDQLPWSRAHFMDPKVMGSLTSEISPTRGYIEAIWARLHEGLDGDSTVVATMPPSPAELPTGAVEGYETRVTWIYGVGVQKDSAQVTCVDAAGEPVSGALHGSRWGAEFTRLHSFQPAGDLLIEGVMTCGLEPGLSRIDELSSAASHPWTARVPCWTPETMTCNEAEPEPASDVISGDTNEPATASPASSSGGCSGADDSTLPGSSLLVLSVALWALRRRDSTVV